MPAPTFSGRHQSPSGVNESSMIPPRDWSRDWTSVYMRSDGGGSSKSARSMVPDASAFGFWPAVLMRMIAPLRKRT